MQRLVVAVAVALLLASAPAAAGPSMPPNTRIKAPPSTLSAAPMTAKVASLRSAAGAVVYDWQKKPVTTSYSAYLTALRKPVSTATNKAKQATFTANLAAIAARNNNTKLGWAASANRFTDMNVTERAKVLLKKGPKGTKRANVVAALAATRMTPAQILAQAPPAVTQDAPAMAAAAAALSAAAVTPQALLDGVPDWSSVLPTVKDQGQCGSCWAFAATSLMEAGHYINTGEVLPLSEKQLVDCDTLDSGCDGGFYENTFTYLTQAGGQTSAAQLPYVAAKGTCPNPLPTRVSKLASWKALPQNNEAAMLAALADGPIGVGITVDNAMFDYAGGVYSSDACGGPANHAVVVVGAGVDDDTNTPYWLVRNSWGESWGEGGYIRILRGVGGAGMCNIASTPYSTLSADTPATPAPPTPPPPPGTGCQNATAVTDNTTNIWRLAAANNASVAQVLIDNGFAKVFDTPWGGRWFPWAPGAVPPTIPVGKTITINTCQNGTWSQPYGAWNGGDDWSGLRAAPYVGFCPAGAYVVEIYARPSWISSRSNAGGWIGRIIMTCSDGTTLTADAMPDNTNTYFPDGSQTQMNGFTTISFKSGYAIDSLLGIGDISGEPGNFTCPTGAILTGFSATAGVNDYWTGAGIIDSLQFFCSNPFSFFPQSAVRMSQLRTSPYPKLKARLSCKSITSGASDTWFSIAAKYSTASFPITFTDVMRANPALGTGVIPKGSKVFIPPCVNGLLQPTSKPTPGVSSGAAPAPNTAEAAAADGAAWDSSTPEGRAAYRAAFDAQPYIQEMAQKAKAAAAAQP